MAENPDYWNTIATVIPVIALTYSTALKRGDWHRLRSATRRWTALYGACLVTLLVWVETMSLGHLQGRTTDTQDEWISFLVVGWAAAQVLAVPIAPLLVMAVHDLHPTVLRAKRDLRKNARNLAVIRKEYADVVAWIKREVLECRIAGSEQVLTDPGLVFSVSGAILPGYIGRVSRWEMAQVIERDTAEKVKVVEEKLGTAEKQLKRSKKRLAKAIRARTKRTAELTDLHR